MVNGKMARGSVESYGISKWEAPKYSGLPNASLYDGGTTASYEGGRSDVLVVGVNTGLVD